MKLFKILILTLIVATSYAQEGIRPWEMRNANGKGYVMISGIDSVMYYDVLNNYIKDTLGYSRIDSIKCVSDTIRLYTNNGQFKMPFSCSGGGGGGGGGLDTVYIKTFTSSTHEDSYKIMFDHSGNQDSILITDNHPSLSVQKTTIGTENTWLFNFGGSDVAEITVDDISNTNEIELPSQTGNNGKYLTTNGTSPSWATIPSGDITAVNTTDYLTGGGTSGDVTIGVDTTGTVGLATKYDLATSGGSGTVTSVAVSAGTSGTDVNVTGSPITTSGTITVNIPTASATNRGALSSTDWSTFNNKISGSGSASRIPYFFNASTISSEEQFMYLNSTGTKIAGIGFTGGNTQFTDYLEPTAGGYLAFDANIAGIGVATSSSNRWAMMNNSSGTLYWNRNSGGTWPATPYMSLSSAGVFKLSDLAGSNTRLVQADLNGTLSTLSNGTSGYVLTSTGTGYSWQASSGGATNLTFTGSSTPFSLNSSTGTGVTFAAGSNISLSRNGNQLTINSTASGTSGLTAFVGAATSVFGTNYVLTQSTNALPKIPYTNQSGSLGITYSVPPNGNSTVTILTNGLYEITYSHNVSSTYQGNGTLFSGVYRNQTIINHSISYNHYPYTASVVYSHTATTIVQLNANDLIEVRTGLTGLTPPAELKVSGATLTIKKLN